VRNSPVSDRLPGRLREVLEGHVRSRQVPGIVAAVERDGRLYVEAFGVRTIGASQPMRWNDVFRIASMTKPITAAAAMILVEDKQLRMDEPVDRLLPELAGRRVLRRVEASLGDTVPATRPITVRDLLTFRMGLGLLLTPPGTLPIQRAMEDLQLGLGPPAPDVLPPPDEWMRRLGTLPLIHQAGEGWMYNTGADVLGVLIARAARKPFETFLEERIFGPLGMDDTRFSVPPAQLNRLPDSYLVNPQSGALELYDAARSGRWSRPPAFPSGAGGLVSTVDDMIVFGRMMRGGGMYDGTRILSAESVAAMTTDHLSPANKAAAHWVPNYFDRHGWGFCMAVVTKTDDLGRSPGAFGWDGGLGTSWYCDPARQLIGVLLTQRAWTSPNPPDVCRDFWRTVTEG
jgi:CubicO group peptidase (beta-lactamase class C family)